MLYLAQYGFPPHYKSKASGFSVHCDVSTSDRKALKRRQNRSFYRLQAVWTRALSENLNNSEVIQS